MDVSLLPLLCAPAQQNNQNVSISAKINAVAGAKFEPVFINAAANAFRVGEVSLLHLRERNRNFGGSRSMQTIEPPGEWTAPVPVEILPDNHSF